MSFSEKTLRGDMNGTDNSLLLDVTVVGLGASAGGIKALSDFLGALPNDLANTAFVVVIHLLPDMESNLAEVLQPQSSLPVTELNDEVELKGGHVYVIPPNKSIALEGSLVKTNPLNGSHRGRLTIDHLFRSMASLQENALGLLFSGSGNDGTMGLKAIKEAGGLVGAQVPEEAQFDSMPRSAVATGILDFVLPAAELAKKVAHLISQGPHVVLPGEQSDKLAKILVHLRSRTGHDFSHYKPSTLLRRVTRRIQINQLVNLDDYLDLTRNNPAESDALFKDLLISVTRFFRDKETWQTLAEQLPKLLRNREREGKVRAWVPGCATGEEAYGLAMLILDSLSEIKRWPEIVVFASDIDEQALAHGRRGLYSESIADDVPERFLQRYFIREGCHYRVSQEVRECMLFASHDLLSDSPFSKLDIISCRNLLIYLNKSMQENVFRIFHYALHPGGLLLLGNAESADGNTKLFRKVNKEHRLYERAKTKETPRLPTTHFAERNLSDSQKPSISSSLPSTKSDLARHQQIIESLVPPSLVVNRNYELVHLSGNAGRYLKRPGGWPSNDLLREVRSELRPDLHVCLHQAFEHGRSTSSRPISLSIEGRPTLVHLIVHPGAEEERAQDRALVIFAEVDEVSSAETKQSDGRGNAAVKQLDEEVERLRTRLQVTIEEFEASKEEMKASNEELQSMNEEYKSTTEELETSKEELQSTNEELAAVNQELKTKVEELSRANSDLNNLIASTDIATLFLDRQLRINRYTPPFAKIYNVMPNDLGRPIGHLTSRLKYDEIIEDGKRVLRKLALVEREVRAADKSWYLVRLRPYRTQDDKIMGVVATFVDITDHKCSLERQQMLMSELDHRVKNILATVRAICQQTARRSDNLAAFMESFTERLGALASVHQLLTKNNWEGVELGNLVNKAIEPHIEDVSGSTVKPEGQQLLLGKRGAQSFYLVLHELATNSVKYGALSGPVGLVEISWSCKEQPECEFLEFTWKESGGPPATKPKADEKGFGLQLIKQTIEYELEGESQLFFTETGLQCRFTIPLPDDGSVVILEPGG